MDFPSSFSTPFLPGSLQVSLRGLPAPPSLSAIDASSSSSSSSSSSANASSSSSLSSSFSSSSNPLSSPSPSPRSGERRSRPFLRRRMTYPTHAGDLRWSQYMLEITTWDRPPIKTASLQTLVRNGIPPALRPQVWPILSGARHLMISNPGYYRRTLLENRGKEAPFMRQIETDLHRTFPELIDFSTLYAENPLSIDKLRAVLTAYGLRNPHVGYCQGMNFLAGFLLRMFPEEEAFWMLVAIIDEILPAHYYESDLRGIKAETDLFSMITAKELPELHQHLENHGIDIGMFTLDWFVSLFVFSYRASTVARIWDLFLYEGRVSLFCISLGILKEVEKSILKLDRMDRLYDFLKNINRVNLNLEKIIRSVNIPVMSNLVKRLSFCVVQTPTYSDTISAAPMARKALDSYSWRTSKSKQNERVEPKLQLKVPDKTEDTSILGSFFNKISPKKSRPPATSSRSGSIDRGKYFG